MSNRRMMRVIRLLLPGAILLQASGCNVLDVVQTVFLGITAAGSIAILENI